jgi:hypothetical protein
MAGWLVYISSIRMAGLYHQQFDFNGCCDASFCRDFQGAAGCRSKMARRTDWCIFTAVLFLIGKYLINLYLSRSSTVSAYGAAGAVVLIILWVYYSAIILYLGAEFTKVYANKYGGKIMPQRIRRFCRT